MDPGPDAGESGGRVGLAGMASGKPFNRAFPLVIWMMLLTDQSLHAKKV